MRKSVKPVYLAGQANVTSRNQDYPPVISHEGPIIGMKVSRS